MKKYSTEGKVKGTMGRRIYLHHRVLHGNQTSKYASRLQQRTTLYWGRR